MHGVRRQEGALKRLLVVVGTVLRTDGCLGYFLAPAFLLSPLDKVTVSGLIFLSPLNCWKVNFSFLFIKISRVVKCYLQMS